MGAVLPRLVRAEWAKLLTTRVWLGLLAGASVLSGASALLVTLFAGNANSGIPPVGSSQYEELAFASPANAIVLTLILGIIGMTQ